MGSISSLYFDLHMQLSLYTMVFSNMPLICGVQKSHAEWHRSPTVGRPHPALQPPWPRGESHGSIGDALPSKCQPVVAVTLVSNFGFVPETYSTFMKKQHDPIPGM